MKNKGFTLLEVLVVVGIMGLMAAMIWPMRGTLDDSQRERVTIEKMEAIVEAILGHEQIKDHYDLSRTIGGYVGDMGKWPKLYEPEGSGLGGVRGTFDGGRFRWTSAFDDVPDTKKESLGQPRGLWAKDEVAAEDRSNWKGPYLTPPVTRNPALGKHYAKNQAEYEGLDPTDREYFHLLQGSEQLTDGWNRAFRFFIIGETGETGVTFCIVSLGPRGFGYEDDYEQDCDPDSPENQGKIIRALRKSDWEAVRDQSSRRSTVITKLIFLTEDRIEQDIVQALIGESPSGPNTGYTGDLLDWPDLYNWVCRFDRDETPSDPYPCEAMCRTASEDWEILYEVRDNEGNVWDGNYKNDVGDKVTCLNGICEKDGSPISFNCELPVGAWDNEYEDGKPFTYGQPRGLWEQGGLADSSFGVGWRHAYHEPPDLHGEDEALLDGFENQFHFFKVETETVSGENEFLIVSGGESGVMTISDSADEAHVFPVPDVGNGTIQDRINATQKTLENKAKVFLKDGYDPEDVNNAGNVMRLVLRNEWLPGFMDVNVVLADLDTDQKCSETTTKCRVYGMLSDQSDLLPGPVWDDEAGLCGFKAKYDDLTPKRIVSGGRYLVCWDDEDVDGNPGPGNPGWWKIFSIYAHPARIDDRTLYLVTSAFQPLP